MAFKDWLKEYRETQGTQSASSTKHSTATSSTSTGNTKQTTSGSTGSGSSGFSFRDSLKEYREKQATISLQGWSDSGINLIKELQDNSSNWYDDNQYKAWEERFTSLLGQADNWRKQYAGNQEAVSYVDSVVDALSKAKSYSFNTRQFYAQWDTKDQYNFWQEHNTVENRQNWYDEQQKRLEDLKSQKKAENARWNEALVGYDPESHEFMTASQEFYSKQKAIDDEIAAVEAEMANYKRGNYNEFGQYYGNKTLDDYHAITERPDFKVTSANRDYDNPTREELWEYDSSASEGSVALGYGGSYDEEGNILDINGNIVRYAKGPEVEDKLGMFFSAGEKGVQEAYNQLSINSGNYTDTWANIMQEGDTQGWKYLDDTEIGIYYALLDDSQEAAYKFLADMAPELTRRETMAKKAYIEEAPVLEQILLNAASIPMNVVGGGVAFAADVISGIKGEEINPYSRAHAMQNTASFIREDTAKDINNLTGNVALPWVGTTFGDVYQSLMSAGDMAYGAMLGGGGQVYATLMGMGAASAEAKRLYDQGASMEQIAAGGILAGAAEMVFEKLSIENLINMKDAKSASQLIKNLLTQGGIEASEEMATEIANTITNVIVMGKQSDWVDLETFARNVVNAGIGGFISGGFGGGVGSVASYSQYNQQAKDTGKTIMGAEGGVDALKALAMDVSGADSKLAKQANKVTGETVDGKGLKATVQNNRSQKAVGKLYDTVQTEVTKQNQADIAKRIEEVGFSPKSAKNIASAVMAQVNGEELSKVQKAALDIVKGNEKVQEAISGILEDGSSSVNKRNVNLTKYALGINLGVGIGPDASRTNPAEAGKEIASTEGNLTTEAKRVSEGHYEVSEDGKAVLDGQEVKLDGFRKTDDGTIMVATADSLTADPGEVTYSSKGQALVYENYANIETTTSNPVIANMDINSRSALAKAYDPASGVDAKVYFLGANQAWWYGFEGISMNEKSLPENSLVNSITKEQREFAYEQGRKAGETAAITQSVGVGAAYQKAVEKLGGKEAAKAVAKRNKGEVVLDSGIKKSSMTKQQRGSVQMAKVVAEATGTNIHVYHGVKEYGKYDTNTGEIWLNINAMFTGQSMMAFTLGHELVHMAKQWNPAEFKDFADYLLEQYGKKGVSAEVLIREQMANAKKNGYELNEHEAYEEVIADACQRMLLDSDAVQKMAAYKAENPTRWQQIIDAIKEFIDKIRQLFVGAEPDSTEASIYKELDAAVKEHLENKFVTMVMDAGEHLSTIRNAFGKGTVVEVNENGEFTLAKGEVNGATKFLYNDYTWENGGRETLAAALKAEGFSKEDIDAALTIMDGKHDLVKDLAKQFPEQDRINNVTITTDLKDGHSVLSALVSNGDYPVNIDLLMVCKKRKAYQRVINRLCETGLIQQATVDALAIAEINKILGKYGFETACLGCFVESRRLRIQEWAQTIVKEWNAEVKKRNPNAKAFGFGKGEAKLTADEVMQLIGELESGGEKNDQGNLNLGQGSAVKRMGVLLDKVPSLRRTLSIEDLITPDGLSSLRRFDSNLFSMVKSRYGSNSPKFVQEFNPYNHELAKYGKVPTEYSSLREYLYAIGGARMQSFSDFIVENWFDYCQIVADLATRKLPMHTYTKEIALVKLFGLTGIKINMSLIPDIDRSLGKEYAGLTRNANGELELIWADKDRFKATGGKSYMQSINFADAIALQNDPRYSANVGTIAVGVSDQHILMMLDDARIRMIIPYHSSGMNPIFADLMGTSYYKDYTMFQNTTVKQLYNSKGQKVSLKLDKTQTGKLTSGFQFNEVLQELGDARAAAEAYKEWCADSSKHTITIKGETYTAELTPKFNDFSGHENYYKLLEDFNTYDCISEQAAPQGDVQQNYPEDFDKILTDELKSQEGHRQKQMESQAFDKAMGEIETYLKSHTKADTVFYAEQHGVKLSAKDKKLGAEDKKKLAELRKGEKMSMPKNQKAPTYEELIAKNPIAVIDIGKNEEGLSYAKLKETVLKNAEKNKVFDVPHPNRDTKVLIFLTEKSFTHAFSNLTKDFGEDTILAMDHISEIIHEAVLTHTAPPKDSNKAETRVFTFFAAVKGQNGIEPVKLTVKEYAKREAEEFPANIRKYFEKNGEQEIHNRLYDAEVLEVISIESAKKESGASASDHNRATRFATKGTPNSIIKIADLLALVNGEERKYIPLPAGTNAGYHAGDLGKAEFLHQQGYGRDTGHFGTGTYFVGTKELIEDSSTYASRPHHAVNFGDYNLYKIRNDDDGYKLHRSLRVIDGGFSQEFLDAAVADKFAVSDLGGNARALIEKYDTQEWNEELEMYFSKDYIGSAIRAYTEVAKDNSLDIQSYDEWLTEQSGEVVLQSDPDYDYYKADYLDYLKDTLKDADAERNNGYDKFRDAYFDLWLRFGLRGKDIKEALRNTLAHQNSFSDSDIRAMSKKNGVDSLATVFMKSMGYEGIDVRGTGLDNTGYGSVIYDLKPDTVIYKAHNANSMSSRQLLANAFDELAQTPKERELMAQYRNHITKVDEVQERLKKLRGEISRLTNANGDKSKIAAMNKTAAELADLIDKYDRKLLELEASKPLRDVLARARSAAYQEAKQRSEKTMKEYRQQVSERFDRGVEGRRKTEMRHKVQNVVKELNDLLLNESKKRHVPDNLKKAVAGALSIVNMDTVDAEERASKYAALIAKEQSKAAPDQDKIDAYTATMENILRQGEKMGQRLKELRDAYEEISESDDPDIANAYDPVIAGAMRELSQTIGNTSIRNMTLDQLSDVYDMYRMVLTRVRDANKTLLENIKESISNLASGVIGEVRVTGGEHTYRAAILDPVRKFLWDNMKPVYAMEWIGSSTLTKVFNNVRAGEDTWAKDVTEARAYYLDKSKKYGYDSWDFEKKYRFDSASGIEFELTLEQILSLYAYSKRDQAHDHLRLGGFVFDSNIETYKEKGSKILKYKVNTAEAHQITPEILAQIIGKLSKEQMGFVDEMQEYLSTVMGAKGNEVTSKMYGVKLFKEKFYFPLKSAKQFMFEQNEVSGEVRIKNSGFTNKVVAKANNPVILSNFMEVWAGHVNDMSMYHSFTLPLEDFNRVFNYNSPKKEGQPPVSVKGTIQNAYSPAAVHYVKNLITDLNGGARTDSTTGFINKMMGLFKKGSVFASMSVVVQQPSAIARAAALVDTKYFIGPKVDHKRHKALWNEVKQYAPVAVIKEMGYFDTNMGKSTQDFILGKEYDGFKDKMKALVNDSDYRDEALSKAPALADEIAWCGIWEAVKREMHDKYPGLDVKAEPFLKLCGSRFTEVITKTQVYDSVLSRSGNMRSKDTGMKMATAFMAEPTTSINMIADALLQGKRGNKKYARKAIGAVIASQILNSILVSFVYAGRDDDEDETYLEKYIGTFTGEMLDSLNPAGYIPFIKDIMSIVQGYDVERSDMAVISDFWKACENLKKDTLSPYRKVEGFVGSIAQIFGLPVKNIMRDARGIYNTIDSFVNGQQTTGAGIGYAVKSALPKLIGGGDVSNDEQLYRATLSGNQAHLDRVKDRYANEKAVNSGMRSAIKEHYLAGDIDSDTAIKYMVSYCGDDEDEAFWKVEEWRHDQKFEEEFGKYNEFYGAVQTGKELKAIIKKYTDNGVTTGTLKSQLTEYFRQQYIEMSTAEKANIKGYLLNAFALLGEDRADAEKRISAWEFEAKNGFNYENRRELFLSGDITGDQVREAVITFGGKTAEEADKEVELLLFEAEYGFAYSEKEDLYKSGKITDSELKHILMSAGGKTAEEADLQIQAYDWEAQGYENVTAASVRDYNEHCATANVPKDVYLHIRSFSNDTKNDVDANGKTIYYSAMKKVMAEINAQYGLTAEQKTAIARSLGWAEKNINKYKLW